MGLYRIGTAARLSGVAVTTVRNWERRYGVVCAARTPGGQRLYTRTDVEQLRRLREWVEEGLSSGEAHNLLRDSPDGPEPDRGEVSGWQARAEARRLRTAAAATHARAADERARAIDALSALAERTDGEHRDRLLSLVQQARAREERR